MYIVSIDLLTSIPNELSNCFLLLIVLSGSFIPKSFFLFFNESLKLISSQLNKEVSTIDFCSSLNSKEGRSDSENPKLILRKK